MQTPDGVTIVFKGGSFSGVLPSTCEIAEEVSLTATGSGVALTLQTGSSFASGSSVVLTGGTITGAGTFANNGTLTLSGGGSVSIATLTKGANGSTTISSASASGTSWAVDSLTTTGDATITTLVSSGAVSVGGDAEGTSWTTSALTTTGDATITTLVSSGAVSIGGDASGTSWTTGALTVSGAFEVPTLILNGASSVDLTNVSHLTLGASAVITIGANASLISLVCLDGAGVVFSSSCLAITGSVQATGTTTLSGSGYFAIPDLTNASTLFTQGTGADVRVCQYGAGVTGLSGSCDGSTVAVAITKTDSTKSVLTEKKVNGVWTLLNATESSASFTTSSAGTVTVLRVYDGASFTEVSVADSAVPHIWLVYTNVVNASLAVGSYNTATQTASSYAVVLEYLMASEYYNVGESIVLMGRVANSQSGSIILPSSISSITYTCYKVSSAWGTETLTAVTGHNGVSVPTNCMLSALETTDSRWTKDSTGYNFLFEPDTTTNQLFTSAGKYRIVVTITPTTGNPAPLVFDITVN